MEHLVLQEPLANPFFKEGFFRDKWFWVEPQPFRKNPYFKQCMCSAFMCEMLKIDVCIHLHTCPYIEVMLQFTLTHSLSLRVTE